MWSPRGTSGGWALKTPSQSAGSAMQGPKDVMRPSYSGQGPRAGNQGPKLRLTDSRTRCCHSHVLAEKVASGWEFNHTCGCVWVRFQGVSRVQETENAGCFLPWGTRQAQMSLQADSRRADVGFFDSFHYSLKCFWREKWPHGDAVDAVSKTCTSLSLARPARRAAQDSGIGFLGETPLGGDPFKH